MKIAGIIAEYNPFHNGHAYHIHETRKQTGADYIIAVISGDFVQRGGPSLFSSHTRARHALLGGADLVFEIPPANSCQSAEHFARAGVDLLNGLGCVDVLSFGCECGDLSLLSGLGSFFSREPDAYRQLLKQELKKGNSFPAARSAAFRSFLETHPLCGKGSREVPAPEILSSKAPGELDAVLNAPNNILGIEYCKALGRTHSSIQPVAVRRKGSGYHDLSADAPLPSASAIRKALRQSSEYPESLGASSWLTGIPEAVREDFCRAVSEEGCLWENDFSLILRWYLYNWDSGDKRPYPDLSPELADRIRRYRDSFQDLTGFITLLKTRELTYTRISRALFHMLLDIRCIPNMAYARLLGFRRDASCVLTEIRAHGQLPLITRLSRDSRYLNASEKAVLEENIRLECLYESVRCSRFRQPFQHPFRKPLVIL